MKKLKLLLLTCLALHAASISARAATVAVNNPAFTKEADDSVTQGMVQSYSSYFYTRNELVGKQYYRIYDILHYPYNYRYYYAYENGPKLAEAWSKMQLRCGVYLYGVQYDRGSSSDRACQQYLTIPDRLSYHCGGPYNFIFNRIDGGYATTWTNAMYYQNHKGSNKSYWGHNYIDVSIAHIAGGSWCVARETLIEDAKGGERLCA